MPMAHFTTTHTYLCFSPPLFPDSSRPAPVSSITFLKDNYFSLHVPHKITHKITHDLSQCWNHRRCAVCMWGLPQKHLPKSLSNSSTTFPKSLWVCPLLFWEEKRSSSLSWLILVADILSRGNTINYFLQFMFFQSWEPQRSSKIALKPRALDTMISWMNPSRETL